MAPLQILLMSFILAKLYHKTQKTNLYYLNKEHYKAQFEQWATEDQEYVSRVNRKRHGTKYQPLTAGVTESVRTHKQKMDKRNRIWRDIIVSILSLPLIFTVIDLKYTSMMFYSTKYYENALLNGKQPGDRSFRDIRNQTSFYEYLNETLLPVLSTMTSDAKEVRSPNGFNIKQRYGKIPMNGTKDKHDGASNKTQETETKKDANNSDKIKPKPREINKGRTNFTPKLDKKRPITTLETDWTMGNTKLISAVRLRQKRVKPNSCRVSSKFSHLISSCNDNLKPMTEDKQNYQEDWSTVATNVEVAEPPNEFSLPFIDNPWVYQLENITSTASRYSKKTFQVLFEKLDEV